jgi:hypothetical protein
MRGVNVSERVVFALVLGLCGLLLLVAAGSAHAAGVPVPRKQKIVRMLVDRGPVEGREWGVRHG